MTAFSDSISSCEMVFKAGLVLQPANSGGYDRFFSHGPLDSLSENLPLESALEALASHSKWTPGNTIPPLSGNVAAMLEESDRSMHPFATVPESAMRKSKTWQTCTYGNIRQFSINHGVNEQ